MICLYYWQSLLEWNYAYSIHIDLIKTEEGNTDIIKVKLFKGKKSFIKHLKNSPAFNE